MRFRLDFTEEELKQNRFGLRTSPQPFTYDHKVLIFNPNVFIIIFDDEKGIGQKAV